MIQNNEPSEEELSEFLTIPEAAQVCGMTRNTMYRWVKEGKVKGYKTLGRKNLIRPEDLLEFLQTTQLYIPPKFVEMVQQKSQASGSTQADAKALSFHSKRRELTVPEAARLCGVQRYTMWRWVHSGRLVASRTAAKKSYYIKPEDLTTFMREHNMFVPPSLESAALRSSMPNQGRRSLLLVDADPESRQLVTSAGNNKYPIVEAATAMEAMVHFDEGDNIGMAYLNLPSLGLDGFQLLSALARNHPDVAVIAVIHNGKAFSEEILSSKNVIMLPDIQLTVSKVREAMKSAFAMHDTLARDIA